MRAIFDAIIDLPPPDRERQLDILTAGDEALRRVVEAVIAKSEHESSPLDSPMGLPALAASPAPSLIGAQIGSYTVVRLIGTGGMGAVYEALRADDQYRKRVAIKVVQRDIDSEVTLARFRRERQILASLDHPNIATLHDGGVMADARPYLVMEYVDGAPITTWCAARNLSLRDRLALFAQVCAAVDHAHRNLVVHRDLKPANILVTNDGVVKLLDFGIAQLLQQDEAEPNGAAMPLTRGGARAYTPEYASPEQIRGEPLTTASDVYSLGVVLFELLTGARPHQAVTGARIDLERAVLETPVPRPSTAITAAASVNLDGAPLERARRRLRGELDSIALMALYSEPERRYPSVEALRQDVQRYLAGLPVRAQGDWLGYRARKFVRRNRLATAASAIAGGALIAGVVLATTAAHRARIEQLKATQSNRFLTQLLASVHPETGSRDVRVSEVLDSAARRIDKEFADAPDVRADLETVIGESYDGLGRYDEAEPHLKNALALRQQVAGANSVSAVVGHSHLGQLYMDKGVLDSARIELNEAIAIQRAHGRTGDSLYATMLSNLGSLAHMEGHAAESEGFHRQALAIRQKLFGPRNDLVSVSLTDLGVSVGEQGRLPEAEQLHRDALVIARANSSKPDERLAGILATLAGDLDLEGKNQAADSAYREALAIRKVVLGASHPEYALTLFNYAGFVFDQKRYQEAAGYSREILALRGTAIPESHPAIAAALQTLGLSLDQVGDHVAAESALMESLALRRKFNKPDSWVIGSSISVLGDHYTLLKEYARAEPLLLQAQAALDGALGAKDGRTLRNTRRLVTLYTAWGKPELAAKYQR